MKFQDLPLWLKCGLIFTGIYILYAVYIIFFPIVFGSSSEFQIKYLFLLFSIIFSFMLGAILGLLVQGILSKNSLSRWSSIIIIVSLITLFLIYMNINLYNSKVIERAYGSEGDVLLCEDIKVFVFFGKEDKFSCVVGWAIRLEDESKCNILRDLPRQFSRCLTEVNKIK